MQCDGNIMSKLQVNPLFCADGNQLNKCSKLHCRMAGASTAQQAGPPVVE